MKIDLNTLALVLGITQVLQVVIFFLQYRVNKTYRGIGWWALGFALLALGFGLAPLRDAGLNDAFYFFSANLLLAVGPMFLYLGTMLFMEQPPRVKWIHAVMLLYVLFVFYFTFVNNLAVIRTIVGSGLVAGLSFLTARSLVLYHTRAIRTAAFFNAAIFFLHGLFFALRAVAPLWNGASDSGATPSALSAVTLLLSLVEGFLLTFGLIVMVNQRLSADSLEAQEQLELIFNTSPDAVLLTRLTDGHFIKMNEAFTTLTGYTRDQVIGKTAHQVPLWQNPQDRVKGMVLLEQYGACENFEFNFCRRDGSSLTGILSARRLMLGGVPHILSVTRDITERRCAEEKLRDSNAQLSALIDHSPLAIIMLTPEGRVLIWNPAAERMYGWTAQESVGNILPIVSREKFAEFSQILARANRGESTPYIEVERRRKDGSPVQLGLAIAPLRDAAGNVYAQMSIAVDISERKQAEQALRQSEARFRSYFELPLTGRAITSTGKRWLDVNATLCEMLGYTKSELLQMTWEEITYPGDLDANRTEFNRLVAGEIDGYTLEKRFLHKAGHVVYVNMAVQCLRKPDGAVDYLVSLLQDITARKQIEAALRESEAKFRFMTENSSDVIWHMDRNFCFTYISPADERMRGFKREEVIGKPVWSLLKPEGIERVRTVNEKRIAREQNGIRTGAVRFELEQICQDGSWIWTEVNVSPYHDANGKLVGYHGVTRDVGERKRLEQELKRQAMTDELTGVSNRRHFIEMAAAELKRALRFEYPLALALIDIDRFKQINDTYGHAAGDAALIEFTRICRRNIREVDLFARFGGDEFALLLPMTGPSEAYLTVDRIRNAVAADPLALDDEMFSFTLSAGLAFLSREQSTLDALLGQADHALYKSKMAGRNHVVSVNPGVE